MKFTELNLHEDLLKGIDGAGFTICTDVQEKSLIHSLKGKDVAVQSQTGTGKTAAFLITIFQNFLADGPIKQKKALIIAPTRELAVQIEKDARLLGKHLDFLIGSFYGGVGYHLQEKLLKNDANIIIGTPGRLLDLGQKGWLDFKKIGYLVIDEADRLFDMGFLPDLRRMLRKMPPYSKRQSMLFSATLDYNTRALSYEFMNDPLKIEISPEKITVDAINQTLYHVGKKEKIRLVLGLLKKEVPKTTLIFTNMKSTAAHVAKHLEFNGYKSLHLSGDLPQKKRLQIIEQFKSGNLPILVATDVAARGLHIDDLELIINYDLPQDCENYVHRIGRTARAGKSGNAISLACEDYVLNLEAIEKYIDIKIPVEYADNDLYEVSKSEGMRFDTRGKDRDRGKREKSRSVRRKPVRKTTSSSSSGNPKQAENKMEKTRQKPKPKPRQKPRPKTEKKPQQSVASATTKEKSRKKSGSQVQRPTARKNTLEDRLEYYRKKYGDNFKVTSEPSKGKPESGSTAKTGKKSFIKKISGIFRKK